MNQEALFLFPLTNGKPEMLKFTYSMLKQWCEIFFAKKKSENERLLGDGFNFR
jgi:hypothetical protein